MTTIDPLPELLVEQVIEPRGVVHVGAHQGQEVPVYRAAGFKRIVLVEPNPVLVAELRELTGVEVVEAACGAETGLATLHVTGNDKLSSLEEPIGRNIVSRVEVPMRRLADVIDETVNVAVIDAQGLELDVVAGAPLATLDLVVLETYVRTKPGGAPAYDDAVAFMSRRGRGWVPVAEWPLDRAGRNLDVAFMRSLR